VKSEGNERPESAYKKNEAVWRSKKSDNAEKRASKATSNKAPEFIKPENIAPKLPEACFLR
jgi:hypothetical protein